MSLLTDIQSELDVLDWSVSKTIATDIIKLVYDWSVQQENQIKPFIYKGQEKGYHQAMEHLRFWLAGRDAKMSAGEAGAQPPRPLPNQSQIKTKTKEATNE